MPMNKNAPESSANINRHCPECEGAFYCSGLAEQEGCWCADLPHVMPSPDKAAKCLCPKCLKQHIDSQRRAECE
jgi:uncharacterized protein